MKIKSHKKSIIYCGNNNEHSLVNQVKDKRRTSQVCDARKAKKYP